MVPTYLQLAYEANYVGRNKDGNGEIFEYEGKVFLAFHRTDKVVEWFLCGDVFHT